MEYRQAAEKYTKLLDACDQNEEGSRAVKGYTRKDLKDWLDWIAQKVERLEAVEPLVEEQGDVSLTDPDARKMKHLNGANEISHNVQIVVDEKNHMVVAVDVTSQAVDYAQFHPMSVLAKDNLGVETLTVLADRGYFSTGQLASAEAEGITPIVSKPNRSHTPDPEYTLSNFTYNEEKDVYICPMGKVLPRKQQRSKTKTDVDYGSKHICKECPVRDKCTTNKDGKYIRRGQLQAVADRSVDKMMNNRALYEKRSSSMYSARSRQVLGFGISPSVKLAW